MEVAVAAAPAPIAAEAVPAEDTPEAAIPEAAEVVEGIPAAAEAVGAVVPPVEAEDADKQKRMISSRSSFFEIVHQCTMLMGSEHVLRIKQFVQLLFAQQAVL